MLYVTHVVEQQVSSAYVQPSEMTICRRVLVGHRVDGRATLGSAMYQISPELVAGVRLGNDARGIELVERERRRRSESLLRFGEVQIEKEQGVEHHIPELKLWLLRRVDPHLVGTRDDRVVEHVDRRAILLPDRLTPNRVHCPRCRLERSARSRSTSRMFV